MKNKVIVNGVDVFKDIEYKENLIKDLKDVISKQEKLLKLYKELSNYVDEQSYAHKLPEINRLKILIKELENE